ncbi:hypothetical protein VP01_966g6 [Puccinia sorghi]|uniref:Uncharacterized protein n=1 Tax=Puccinia sorghi TaxID=27349 RepID=A0A0L6U619_9BASI|nr:hypothetical protein VP01_966g6 [Puccinia sorghi]
MYVKADINSSILKEMKGKNIVYIPVPNEWRIKSSGKIICHMPIHLYADDTSGHKSKKWNKQISFYMNLYDLPPNMTNVEYNFHFLATSNVADVLEISEPIIKELNELLTQGCVGFDPYLQQEVLIKSMALTFLEDSPMSEEVTNTTQQGSSNNPFRICHLRVDLSGNQPGSGKKLYKEIRDVSQTGTQDAKFLKRNPIKYKIHFFHLNHLMDVKTTQLKYYMSISWGSGDCLTLIQKKIPPIQPQYMIKHYKSFIGKDFQVVIQAAPFVFFPHMDQSQKEIWLLLWVHKSKIHILLNLPESIRRFGPPSLFATENPSRDIAINFSNYQTISALLSGTFYFDKQSKVYVQASQKVQEMFLNTQRIQSNMGYNSQMLLEGEETPTLYDHKVRSEDQTKFPQRLQEMYPTFHI